MRRARESHAMVSGVAEATLLPEASAVSVIGLSLLPFPPCQPEIGEQRREYQERDHRDRDCRALAELAAGNAALERERCQKMRGVDRPAPGDRVDQLKIGE